MRAQKLHDSSPIPPYKCQYSSCIRNKFFMTIDWNEFIKSWIYSIMTCVIDILTFMMILMGQKVRWMQEVHLGMRIKRSIWCAVIYETFSFSCIFFFFFLFLLPKKNTKYCIEWKIDKALTQKWWIEYHKNILFQLFLFISRHRMRCRLWIFLSVCWRVVLNCEEILNVFLHFKLSKLKII